MLEHIPNLFSVSLINVNVMDLQSERVDCSASSTETEGKRKLNEFESLWRYLMTDLECNCFFSEILEDIKNLKEQVDSLSASDQSQGTRLDTLDTRTTGGTWCAYQNGPVTSTGTIRYDRLTFSNTNLAISGTPLSYRTGRYSYKIC